jgi:predicted amidohydrolase
MGDPQDRRDLLGDTIVIRGGALRVRETFIGKNPKEAEPLDGPSGNLLARNAAPLNMYVWGTYYEKPGDLVYNTASSSDRKRNREGTCTKNLPWDPEPEQGVTSGTGFPLLQTDFGTVGTVICSDSWFSEVAGILALKGAESVLNPNQNHCPHLCIACPLTIASRSR